jgi:hypothetical protein
VTTKDAILFGKVRNLKAEEIQVVCVVDIKHLLARGGSHDNQPDRWEQIGEEVPAVAPNTV